MKIIKTYLMISVFCTCITTHSGLMQRWSKGAKNFLQTLKRSVWNNERQVWNQETQNAELTPKEQFNYRKRLETDIKEFKEGFNSKIGEPAKNLGSQITDNYNKLQANPKFQKIWNPITETWDQAKGQLNNPGGPDLSQLKNWIKNQSEPTRQRILAKLSQLKRAKAESEMEASEQHRQAIETYDNEGNPHAKAEAKSENEYFDLFIIPQKWADLKPNLKPIDILKYKEAIDLKCLKWINRDLETLTFQQESKDKITQLINKCNGLVDTKISKKADAAIVALFMLKDLLYLFNGDKIKSKQYRRQEDIIIQNHIYARHLTFVKENEQLIINKIESSMADIIEKPFWVVIPMPQDINYTSITFDSLQFLEKFQHDFIEKINNNQYNADIRARSQKSEPPTKESIIEITLTEYQNKILNFLQSNEPIRYSTKH